jgi:SAM-dependent methyltransferase
VSAAPRTCIACGEAPRPDFLLHNGSTLLRCPGCGLGWWDWPPLEPAEFYDESYFQSAGDPKGYDDYASLEAGVRRTARGRLRRLAKLVRRDKSGPPTTLFEIGCGTGVFLDEARKAGWTVAGAEVSRYAAERARARGLDARAAGVEELVLPPDAFDVVAMWDVIEHLRDPAAALRTAAAAVRPGGCVAASTGDLGSTCARWSGARWHLFNLPEHLFFFTPASLSRLMSRAGASVERVTRELNWIPVSYALERLQKPLLGRTRFRAPGWTTRLVFPATLGDVIGVYARKTG